MTRAIEHDERTAEHMESHPILIGGTDRFLSGWGKAEGRKSYAFWACRPEDANAVDRWVRQRVDIQRVREVGADYRPSDDAHVTVYVVHENHAARKA